MIDKLGFKKGRIVEALVTTYNDNRSPNVAPMGVYGANNRTIILKVHKGSDTCANILRTRACVVNLVYDPILFIRSALMPKNEPEVETKDVERAKFVDAPYLKNSHAFIEAELSNSRTYIKKDRLGKSRVYIFNFMVLNVEILKKHPVGFNRGFATVVELAIDLTRGIEERVEDHLRIIRRTLSAEEYREILFILDKYL